MARIFSLVILVTIFAVSCAETHYGDGSSRKKLGEGALEANGASSAGLVGGTEGFFHGEDHGGEDGGLGTDKRGGEPKSCEDKCNKSFMDAKKACDKAYPDHQKDWMKCAEKAMYAGDTCRANC